MPDRRTFLARGLTLGGAALLGPSLTGVEAAVRPDPSSGSPLAGDAAARSRVVHCRDTDLRPRGAVDGDRLARLLDETLQALFDEDDPLDAWRRVAAPHETVGLKVNCLAGAGLSTSPDLVEAVIERLRGVGVPAGRIVIWDRLDSDLEDAGFAVTRQGPGVRRIGNDSAGFENRLSVYGEAGSLLCRTLTRLCDAVINLPVLKDHGITGLTGALKNLFGAIHNPNKYHLGAGDPYIPDVYCLGPIRRKVRLHLCDATTAQYEGGPSFLAHWTWPCDSLLAAVDPVALDRICWDIIEAERATRGLDSLTKAGREPTWIATAADARHRLGVADPNRIDLVRRDVTGAKAVGGAG